MEGVSVIEYQKRIDEKPLPKYPSVFKIERTIQELKLQALKEAEKEKSQALREIKTSIEAGRLDREKLINLVKIREFAKEHDIIELQKTVLDVVRELQKTSPAKKITLDLGEMKRIDEGFVVEKSEDGKIRIYEILR